MDKEYTSKVESTREKFEEPELIVGRTIKSNQIWRDANLIPTQAPSTLEGLVQKNSPDGATYLSGIVYKFNDGATVHDLISYYSELPITRVVGTLNCYSNVLLKNIILEDFDKSYVPVIFINGNRLAYGLGRPIFDIAAGTLYFKDYDFATKHVNDKFTISFYKYIGRMGTSIGTNLDNPDLPFRDSIKHFKNAENDDQTATLKIRGDIKNTNYILPSEDNRKGVDESDINSGAWYDKSLDPSSKDTGVILLQETLEDTLWCQNTKISGGNWENANGQGLEVRR